jgi:alpha-mannosidase
MLYPIGWGDGGGGSSRLHLEFLRRTANLEGIPKMRMAGPVEFFKDLVTLGPVKNRYVGELYFQNHRGTYTTQAKTKLGNRKSEFALREAEIWGVAAHALNGFAFGLETLDAYWKTVLLHQFHDALPGSSIHRVYEEVERDYNEVIAKAQDVTQQAASTLTEPAATITIFNSLSWPRTALVSLPEGVTPSGMVQKAGARTLVEVNLPACGWSTLQQGLTPAEQHSELAVSATERLLENEYLRVQFNHLGEITSLKDKETGRETISGLSNSFKMYKDVPAWFDAWDIDPQYVETPVELPQTASLTLESAGPLVGQLKLSRALSDNSNLTQLISLRRDSRRIDFETTIDWQESHKLLKVAFPVDIHANEALHEIQFGYIARPNHYSRPYDADRFEVSNHKWSALLEANRGAAVLNDSKYGVSVLRNSINLTLLKSSLAPDMTADKGVQTFTYALYTWNGSLAESDLIKESYDLNIPVVIIKGAASKNGKGSLFSLDAKNIVIETVKPAEDGSSKIVLRLYESMHMSTACELKTSLPVKHAALADMLENKQEDLACVNGIVQLEFHPFEIKTVILTIK